MLKGSVNKGLFSLGKQIGYSEHAKMLLEIDIPACLGQRRHVAKQVLAIFSIWRWCIVLRALLCC